MADQSAYTRVPNALLELMPRLPDAECRVMLVVLRKTLGWQKLSDEISITQFEEYTGLSRQGVLDGIESAINRKTLTRTPSGRNNGYVYQIEGDTVISLLSELKPSTRLTTLRSSQPSRPLEHASSQPSRPPVVNLVDHLAPQVVNLVDPQKKDLKERLSRKRNTPPAVTPEIIRTTLADVCKVDLHDGLKKSILAVNTSAAALWKTAERQGKSPDDVARAIRYVAGWFTRCDWRGKRGEHPRPDQIREVWRAAMEARDATPTPTPAHLNGTSDILTPEQIRQRLQSYGTPE